MNDYYGDIVYEYDNIKRDISQSLNIYSKILELGKVNLQKIRELPAGLCRYFFLNTSIFLGFLKGVLKEIP